ncbi:MAG TPA: LEPR-XLL domain-containing protein, partial [Rhodopila sp.]|nr:LEPR-XLL domain-containing protein [Rhodopila sp.]
MGLYQRLLRTVSQEALFARGQDGDGASRVGKAASDTADRLLRTPLVFETLEPRVLLSGDPITAAAQNALLAGLQSFESWTATQLNHQAQLAQQLPVVSTSVGDLVDLPGQIQTHLVQPIESYLASNGSASTYQGLAAALQADPAEAGGVVGLFAHGEYLFTLSTFQTSAPITAPLDLASGSAGISLQIGTPPTLAGQATVSMALTFGYDTGSATGAKPGFFVQPATITEAVSLGASGFNAKATLGAVDATVTGGSASVAATATVQLKDPVAGDPDNYITPAELGQAPAAMVSTSLSGTANLTLPISSSLVADGTQSLQLTWSGELSGAGTSNLDSLGVWAQLDTISPALVRQAIGALPGLISSAAGGTGFGAGVPVLGPALGQLFDFGSDFADAAVAVGTATSLDQVAAALRNTGISVTFSVNEADNELDMLVTASNAFDTTLPYAVDAPVDGRDLVLNGTLNATGTATAAINLSLSFDDAEPDASRVALIENGSVLRLAFDAVSSGPITAAALGLIHMTVNDGSLVVGARNGGGADPAKPATATINFASTAGGRVTLAQLLADPNGSIAAPVYTGAIQATLPLVSDDGGSTANLGVTWLLDQPAGVSNPQVTGLLVDPALTAQSVAGLQTLVPWAAAITTAADQTGVLTTQMPLVNETMAQLSGFAPATSGTFPGLLNVIAGAINSYAVVGASTDNFQASIISALAAFTAANPAYTFTVSASAGEASSPAALEALGLPPGSQQLVFTLDVTARYAGTQTLSLTAGATDDNIAFSTTGTVQGSVNLNMTFGFALTPNLAAQDATFVVLNGLTVAASVQNSAASFPIAVGLLGATATGMLGLGTSANISLVSDGSGTPQANTVGDILGISAGTLVNVAEQQPSTVSSTLSLSTTFGSLSGGLATLAISGDPLGSAPLTFGFTGGQATNFQSFANLAPTDLLGALSTLASIMDDAGATPALSADVPLTSLPVGQAADFGSVFDADVVNALSNNQTHTPTFNSIQQFETDLAALTGITNSSVTYVAGYNQIDVAFTLAETFAATPASFTWDLTGGAGTILGDLTDVSATTATATLSVSGTGTVSLAFGFDLTPNTVQIKATTSVPTNGVLVAGSDAHFALSLTAPGAAAATVVNVTVAASATQSNTNATQLLATINAALQAALAGAGLAANLVTATFANGTDDLVLTLIPGVFTGLSVTTTPEDAAVYELGLTPAGTPTATIQGNTALPSNGVLTANATFTVAADGGAATPITITAASTASNTNSSQLVAEIKTALAPVNTALAAANRSPIVVSMTSAGLLTFTVSGYASTLSITGANTAAQNGLGLSPSRSVEAGAPEVYVEASAGPVPTDDILTQDVTFSIAVDGRPAVNVTVTAASTAGNTTVNAEAQNTTPQQMLVDEINAALASVNAGLASAGLAQVTASIGTASSNADLDAGSATSNSNGVLFFSTLGSSASIVIKGQTGNQLGIGSNDASVAPMLSVTGGQSFSSNIDLTKLALNANLALTGSVSATADLGVVAIDFGPGNIAINPTVSEAFDAGSVTLANLTANPATIGNYFSATLGGAAAVTLPISAADGLGSALGLDANAALTLNATNMFTLSGWTADTSALEGLNSLVDFSYADAKAAVTQLGQLVTASTGNADGLFGQIVPLINQPLGTVTGITQDFANLAADLQPGTNFTLDQLQSQLNAAIAKAFGLPTTGSYVGVKLTGGILQLTLTFTPVLASSSVPLDFKLSALGLPGNANLPGVTDFGGGNITLTPSASFTLALDINLQSPTNPIYELGAATKFVLGLLIDGPSSGTLSLGPLGLTFTGANLVLSQKTGDTTDPATFTVGLNSTTALSTLSQDLAGSTWLSASGPFTATIVGQVNVSLPLSATIGGSTSSLGTMTLTIPNLGKFTTDLLTNDGSIASDINFAPPSLGSDFSSLDLMGNITGIVGALDSYLNQLQSVLNGQLFGLDIPVIGTALSSAGSFVTQLKTTIDKALSSGVSGFQGIYDELTTLLTPFDPPTPVVQIQYLTSGSSTFQTFTSGEATSLLPSAQNIQDVQIVFTLGSTWSPGTQPTFNLGLPGLGLSVSQGAVSVSVGWNLTFTLGIDRDSGPYLVAPTSGSNVTADIIANVSTTAAITAQLGFLGLTATQPVPGKPDPDNTAVTAYQTGVGLNFSAGFKGGSSTIGGESVIPVSQFGGNNLNISLTGSAAVDLDLALGFDISGGKVDTQYPNFTAQLLVGTASGSSSPGAWTFGVGLNGANSTSPDVALNNISLDLGDFLNNYLGKIINPLAEVLKPIQPILDFLATPIPIINESLIQAVISLFGGDVQGFSQIVSFVDAIVNFVGDFSNGQQLTIGLGNFNLDQFDLRQTPGSGGNAIPDDTTTSGSSQLMSDLQNSSDFTADPSNPDPLQAAENDSSGFDSFMTQAGAGSITFPILTNPMTLIGLLFGQQANLVVITSPELYAQVSTSIDIPVYPFVTADLVASFSIDARFSGGYDTTGILEAVHDVTSNPSAIPGDLLDGFFINDAALQSLIGIEPATFIGIQGMIGVGASVGFGSLLSVGVGGGIGLSLSVSLKDSVPDTYGTAAYRQANDGDGKTRPSEIAAWVDDFGNPLCAFNLNGDVTADLFTEEQVLGATFTQTIFNVTLFSFTVGANCTTVNEPLGVENADGLLTLYTGPLWDLRDVPGAGPSEEGNDDFTVSQKAPGDILVTANDGASEEFKNVTGLYSTLGTGNNTLDITEPLTQVGGAAIDETIIGGTGSQAGNDTITAGGGDDLIETGDGADQVEGGNGSDTIYGGTPNSPGVSINITSTKTVNAQGNSTTTDQTVYGDTITGGTAGGNLIYGSFGSDLITAPGGHNTVFGGSDDFNVVVKPGPDSMWGGPATISTSVPNVIEGEGSGNLLVGGSGNDEIEGGGGSNTIVGGGGNNLLIGGPGSNLVYGGVNAAYVTAEAATLASKAPPSSYAITNPGKASTPVPVPNQSSGALGQNVIFGGSASLNLLQQYGDENAWIALGLPVNGLPVNSAMAPAPATGDGPDTIHAGTLGDLVFGGEVNNTIYGGAGPDTLVGGPSTDLITGGGGNELIWDRGKATIYGGTGNDTIHGGPESNTIYGNTVTGSNGGNDSIQGGDAGNSIYGGTGDATIYGGNGADTIYGDSVAGGKGGNDYIRGQAGNDTIIGGIGNDTIYGDGGADTVYGGSGNDYIGGGAGNDTILGGTGNDSIYGGTGSNTLFGGQGKDFISAIGGMDDSVFGGSGNTTIYGGINNDTLAGGEGADCIFGGLGSDQITGGSGADTITGGGGFDIIVGGTGNDSIQGGTGGDLIHGGTGADTITGGSGGESIYAGALASDITGGSGADLLVGGASHDTITGGSGPDTLYAGSAPGNVLSGGTGNDLIYGTDSIGAAGKGDTITGGAGNVTIWGSAGDDSIFGGSGNDVIHAGLGNQTIYGGTGTDLIFGGPGNDELFGDLTDTTLTEDTIYGGTGTSTIMGNAGDDELYGGDGRDSITGGGGDDVIYGGNGTGKTIVSGGGDATIWGSVGGGDSISGGTGNVEVFGEGGSNTITGGAGNDTIEGELTGNLISGGTGNDLLVGGEGGDTINGGLLSSPSAGTGQDTIYGDTGSTS